MHQTELLAKNVGSGGGGSPGLHLADDGTVIALGSAVDQGTTGGLASYRPGEVAAGGIEPGVICRAADELRRRGLAD